MMRLFSGVQPELRRILKIAELDKRHEELAALAVELGCSQASLYIVGADNLKFMEDEIIRRIYEAAREERESRVWFAAALSALASVISAATALVAICITKV